MADAQYIEVIIVSYYLIESMKRVFLYNLNPQSAHLMPDLAAEVACRQHPSLHSQVI